MNKQQTREAIAVMQAYVMGKTIECRCEKKEWTRLTLAEPSWNWQETEYRITPEPMEIEVWVDDRNGLFLSVLGDRDHQAFMERGGYTKKKFREVL